MAMVIDTAAIRMSWTIPSCRREMASMLLAKFINRNPWFRLLGQTI